MNVYQPVERVVDLLDHEANQILNMSVFEAAEIVGSGEVDRIREIDGHFALLHKCGQLIRMARSLGRPITANAY